MLLTTTTVGAAVFGGYKRIEKIMTGLLLVILACFIVVAVKGLLDWQTWLALGGGLELRHVMADPAAPDRFLLVDVTRTRSDGRWVTLVFNLAPG